uniref:MORN repeat-containing protein 5 n=1 Tax=Hanusia phi TaxID=3032 RepID=A0A7S0HIS5_9CRYP|mmetsp:Transcript_20265/g.46046  ORF Transcript_20265/g.46046 Transcript_20265/m.46046 type:complete len:970 (+) Transcript_20265:85-2994(+)
MVINTSNKVPDFDMQSMSEAKINGARCDLSTAALPLFGPPPSPPCSQPSSVKSDTSSPELNSIAAMDIPRGPLSNFGSISLQTRLVYDSDPMSSDTATGSSGSPRSPRLQNFASNQLHPGLDEAIEPGGINKKLRRNLNVSTGHRWRWLAVRASVRFSGESNHSNLARFCGLERSESRGKKHTGEEGSSAEDALLAYALKANTMLQRGHSIGRDLWKNLQVIDNQASLKSFPFPDSDSRRSQQGGAAETERDSWSSTALKGLNLLISKERNARGSGNDDSDTQAGSECGSVSGPKSSPQTPSHASSPDSWTDIIAPLKASLQATVSSLKSSAMTDLNKFVQSLPRSSGESAPSFFNPRGQGEESQRARTIVTVDGHMYEGSFLDGIAHGYGRMTWPDGQWFQGEFLHGKSDGLGRRVWSSGHEYVGEEHRGFRHGIGIMCWPGGKRYEGEFRMDMKEGIGLLWSSSDKFYVGGWSRNEPHGFGLEHVQGTVAFVEYVRGKVLKRMEIAADLRRRVKANLDVPDEMSLLPADSTYKLHLLPLPGYVRTAPPQRAKSIEIIKTEEAEAASEKHRRRGRERVCSRQSPGDSDRSASEHSRDEHSDDEREEQEEEEEVKMATESRPPPLQNRWRVSVLHGDIVAIPSSSEESNLEEVIIDETDLDQIIQKSAPQDSPASCGLDDPLVVEEDSGSSLNSSVCSYSSEEEESEDSWSSGDDGKRSNTKERMSDKILEIVMGGPLERLIDEDDGIPCRGQDGAAAQVGLAEQLCSQERSGQQEILEPSAEAQLEDADAQFPVSPSLTSSSSDQHWAGQAVQGGDVSKVETALRAHADPNMLSSSGLTALHVASLEGKDEILRLLLGGKGDVNMKSKTGLTCLHYAAQAGKASTCQLLISEGAGINVTTSLEKSSALHLAVLNRRGKVVRLLLQHGAAWSTANAAGLTPMDMAKKLKDAAIVEEMRKVSSELPGAQV